MKILICDGLIPDAVAQLESAGHDVDLRKGIPADELMEVCPNYEVLVVRSATKVTKEVMERASNLKLVVRGGVGLDNVDREAAKEHGVTVNNTPTATSISVAEYTLGLMLSLARHVAIANSSVQNGEWNRKAYAGTELYGKTLGILGFGRIGQEVAKRAQAFGMTVAAFDQYINSSVFTEYNVQSCENLSTLLAQSDYLTLHIPMTPDTKGIINGERLQEMKQGAYIINTARGGLIDDAALVASIEAGHIAGAAIDVYEVEPPAADHVYRGIPQILTLPHLGGSTAEGQYRAGMEVATIINRFQ